MSKVHEDNAGYVGVSYEETQDPYYSYNKLSLPLGESEKSVVREEVTHTVTQAGGKFVIDGTSQKAVPLAEGGVYTFDQSDSSNTGHPLRFSEYEDGTHGDNFGLFNGTDARYLRGNGSTILAGTDPFTVEAWIKPNTNVIIGLFDATSGQTAGPRNYGNNTFAIQGYESTGAVVPTSAVKVGQWQHIAVSYRINTGVGPAMRMDIWVHIDGVRVATGYRDGGAYTVRPTFDIGTINQGGDGKFNGLIRNFRVTPYLVYPDISFTPPTFASTPATTNISVASQSKTWGQLNSGGATGSFAEVNPQYIPFTLPVNYDCVDFATSPYPPTGASFTVVFGATGASFDAYYLDLNNTWQSLGTGLTNAANSTRTFTPSTRFKVIRLYSTTGNLGAVEVVNAYNTYDAQNARVSTLNSGLTNTVSGGAALTNNNVVLGPVEYTTGVTATGTPGQAGAKTEIVVPFGAPDLHYYCSQHSGMGSSAVTPENRFMFEGALPVLKTTNQFGKSGLVGEAVLVVGDPTSSTDNPFGTGNGHSVDFDGNDALRIAGGSIGTGDWTIEYWIKGADFGGIKRHVSAREMTYGDEHTNLRSYNGSWEFYAGDDPGFQSYSGTTISTNTWVHAAVVRNGTTIEYFADGSRIATDTIGATTTTTLTEVDVAHGYGSEYFTGKISNVRVSNTARYSGTSYTIPTATFTSDANTLLLAAHTSNVSTVAGTWSSGSMSGTEQAAEDEFASSLFLALPLYKNTNDVSNSINSSSTTKSASNNTPSASTAQSHYYGGSMHFDSNSESLTYSEQGSELVLGSGDFTIECWIYDDNSHDGTGNRCYIWDNRAGGSVPGDPPQIYANVDGHNTLNIEATGASVSYSFDPMFKWTHIAVTREGTTVRFFVNGRQIGSGTSNTNFTNNGIGIGRAIDANYGWSGYIQDFRMYKACKYKQSFQVPNQIDVTDLSGNGNDAQVRGAQFQTSISKYYGGAPRFQVTSGGSEGEAINVDGSNGDFAFGTGDFTVEFWYQANPSEANISYNALIGNIAGSASGYWRIGSVYAGTSILWFTYTTGSYNDVNSSVDIRDNQWHHIAATREGSTIRLFKDGQLVKSASPVTTDFNQTTDLNIMYSAQQPGYASGYMQDVRVYKGIAKYTSSFSPPERSVQGTARRYPSGVHVVS